jgi:hypothetical protein
VSWIGGLLLFSGWAIAIAAVLLFTGVGQRAVFVLAGVLVEMLGLGLLGYRFMLAQRKASQDSSRGHR